MTNIGSLNITISRTASGNQDYLQIMSDDMQSVNVVLIADHIIVNDSRPGESDQPDIIDASKPPE